MVRMLDMYHKSPYNSCLLIGPASLKCPFRHFEFLASPHCKLYDVWKHSPQKVLSYKMSSLRVLKVILFYTVSMHCTHVTSASTLVTEDSRVGVRELQEGRQPGG